MKRKLISLLILLVLLGSLVYPAAAANYRFSVPSELVNLTVNPDGTATIEYYIDFNNSGDPIDYIDIGVPNDRYSLGSITAEVDGKTITDIEDSPYVKPGIALGLGGNAIQPGKTGKVHVIIPNLPNLFYKASSQEKEPYASFNFSPSWFDSSIVTGSTYLTVNVILPKGLQPDEPRYLPPKSWPGQQAPQTGINDSNLYFYTWSASNANAKTQYIFGATFPARLIPANTLQTAPLFNINIDFGTVVLYGVCGGFVLIFGLSIYGAVVGAKKRKLAYLPPKIAIEGMGIKRGLTAVEAAILMEQPMDKILTMILFSVVKKGAATVTKKEPLTLSITDPSPEGLNPYEIDFLNAFKDVSIANKSKPLQAMVVALVKSLTEKMKGFSRKDTIAYYTDIMKKAWEQVESAQTPEVKMQKYDEQLDWTMLDRDFDGRTRNVFRGGPVFVPVWWGHYDPTFRGGGVSAPSTGGSGGINVNIPRPNVPGADFAASMVNSVQTFAGGVVGDITSFTSGITNQTNPAPVVTNTASSSWRSGGGSSGGGRCACACACACAGCACACAGGGR